jgi:beta-N-acetylhexosaminidase
MTKIRLAIFILFIAPCLFGQVDNQLPEPHVINLESFLANDTVLDKKVDSVFSTLKNEAVVAQLIMPAVGRMGSPEDSIKEFIRKGQIGGVLLLNGTKTQCTNWAKSFEEMNAQNGNLPFLYSADAEPSLVNRKIKGSTPVPRANEITDILEVYKVAQTISKDLNDIGINYNFAPVVDLASNKTVGYRGFGTNPDNVVPFSNVFIEQTQRQNIVATAKHFPGHGLVSGDTHKSLQVIDGELKELKNYPPLIKKGVLSIMVAHIAVKNNSKFNTDGLPSTISKVIINDLLRDSLDFKGLIVTDAMNMGGIAKLKNTSVRAIEAGCDILLMPKDAGLAHRKLMTKYTEDAEFKTKVDLAAKRIIRMKICLGLIN